MALASGCAARHTACSIISKSSSSRPLLFSPPHAACFKFRTAILCLPGREVRADDPLPLLAYICMSNHHKQKRTTPVSTQRHPGRLPSNTRPPALPPTSSPWKQYRQHYSYHFERESIPYLRSLPLSLVVRVLACSRSSPPCAAGKHSPSSSSPVAAIACFVDVLIRECMLQGTAARQVFGEQSPRARQGHDAGGRKEAGGARAGDSHRRQQTGELGHKRRKRAAYTRLRDHRALRLRPQRRGRGDDAATERQANPAASFRCSGGGLVAGVNCHRKPMEMGRGRRSGNRRGQRAVACGGTSTGRPRLLDWMQCQCIILLIRFSQ